MKGSRKETENRWNQVAIGTLLTLFASLVFFLNGCSWGFTPDAHGRHSVDHHGDFHHGEDCVVCSGGEPTASAISTSVCSHCGEHHRH